MSARGSGYTVNDAHFAGWEAFAEGAELAANPESKGSDEWCAWQTGWLCNEEASRACPDDPVGYVLREVENRVLAQELGYMGLVEKITAAATTLAEMLALRAPAVLLDGTFRPWLRLTVKKLLEAEPPAWGVKGGSDGA